MRLIADSIRGLPVSEAEAQLLIRYQRSVPELLKLLRSALANAKNKNLDVNKLFVSSIIVNQGPMLKRFLPRAQGRATPLQKKMSHVSLVLTEVEKDFKPRFIILPPVKKEKKNKAAKKRTEPKPAKTERKEMAPEVEKRGWIKRIFRRKTAS